jgi:hypothetical protein
LLEATRLQADGYRYEGDRACGFPVACSFLLSQPERGVDSRIGEAVGY